MSSTPAKKIVIWGAGGHATTIVEMLRQRPELVIAGFLDDVHPDRHGRELHGSRVLGGRERFPELKAAGVTHYVIAVGNCAARLRLAAEARSAGFLPLTVIDSRAVVSPEAKIGAGSAIMAGAVIEPSVIGEEVVVNYNAVIGHDCVVGDGSTISPLSFLGGGTRLGRGVWVGAGAQIREKMTVGDGSYVALGAVVVAPMLAGMVCQGVPARPVKKFRD